MAKEGRNSPNESNRQVGVTELGQRAWRLQGYRTAKLNLYSCAMHDSRSDPYMSLRCSLSLMNAEFVAVGVYHNCRPAPW